MTRLLPLLLLLPTLALGQGLTPLAPGQTGGGKTLLSLPFSTPGCYSSGTGSVSITRAASSTYENPAGTINTCAAGSYRVEESGLLVEPQTAGYAKYNEAIAENTTPAGAQVWSNQSTSVLAVSGAPIGTWAEVSGSTASSALYQSIPSIGSSPRVLSAWVAKASGSGYAGLMFECNAGGASGCSCVRSDGGVCTATSPVSSMCLAEVSNLGTAPVRLSVVGSCVTATTGGYVYLIPGRWGVASASTTRFAAVDLTPTTYPQSHIPTTGTSASRAADAVSVASGLPTGSNKFCVTGTFKPYGGREWVISPNPTNIRQNLMDLGNTAPARLAAATIWEDGRYEIYATNDSYATSREWRTAPLTYSAGSSHRLSTCMSAGSATVIGDGSQIGTPVQNFSGTGLFSNSLSPMYLGSAYGVSPAGAWHLKNIKVCSGTYKDKACQ